MKKLVGLASVLVLSALASAWQYTPGGPPASGPTWGIGRGISEPKREKPPEFRTLTGVVLDKGDTPLKQAIVYLTNRQTKKTFTFIADDKGAFRFPNLSRREDYEVYAEVKGQKSPSKTLSSFDGRVNPRINLYVEPKPEGSQPAKAEAKQAATEEQKPEQSAKQEQKPEEKKDAPKTAEPAQPPPSPPQ